VKPVWFFDDQDELAVGLRAHLYSCGLHFGARGQDGAWD
jgi:hypothetical protein